MVPSPFEVLHAALFALCSLLFVGGVEAADRYDYLITGNGAGMGTEGVRLALGIDTGPTPDEPCHNVAASNPTVAMPWTDSGYSLGISINRTINSTYPYVYAAVDEADTYNGCTAVEGWCIGAARYDVSDTDGSPSIVWSWDAQVDLDDEPVVSDVAAVKNGSIDTAVLLNKADDGNVFQHVTSSPGTNANYPGMTHMSKVRWAGTGYFVASETMSMDGSVDGRMILGKRMTDGLLWPRSVVVDGPSGSKPEGFDVIALNGGNRGSCNSDAEYLVYVSDYKNSRLYLFWVDTDSGYESINEQDVYGTSDPWISLDTDKNAHATALGGTCNPSSVRFHPDGDSFVTCQTRDSIMRLDTLSDLCDPSWEYGSGHEARLKKITSGTPSCTNEVTPTDCGGTGDCEPHTIEFDPFIRGGDDWLYIGLTQVGELSVVLTTDLSDQRVLYRDTSSFEPFDFVVLPSCDPTDTVHCVYP